MLPQPSRTVQVRTIPDGATLYLDGRMVETTTPSRVEITDDDFHELRAEMPEGRLMVASAAVINENFYNAHKQVYGHAFRDQTLQQ